MCHLLHIRPLSLRDNFKYSGLSSAPVSVHVVSHHCFERIGWIQSKSEYLQTPEVAAHDADGRECIGVEQYYAGFASPLRRFSIVRVPILVTDVEGGAQGSTARVDHLHELRIGGIQPFRNRSHGDRD